MSAQPCRTCGSHDCAHKRAGRKRAATFTREFQQTARAYVSRASLQRAGAKGFQALVERRGFYAAAEFLAEWRRAHPSSLQLAVRAWLVELGEYFLEDVHLRHGVFPDFQLPVRSVIVEVDGRGFHERTGWLGDNRDRRPPIRERIMRDEGYRVLHLSERAIRDGSGRQVLLTFLQEARS